MKRLEITKKIGTSLRRVKFKLGQNSPEILVIVGIGCMAGSTVAACFATLKSKDVVVKVKSDKEHIEQDVVNENLPEYTEEEAKNELRVVYAKAVTRIVAYYTPSVALGLLGTTCILGSNRKLRKRTAEVIAAYATIDKSFKEYRKRVAERYGEEAEKEIRYNIKDKKVEKTVVGDNGKEKKVKENVKVSDLAACSDYACYFDRTTSRNWKETHNYNLMFISMQERFANELLIVDRYLFLNDVLKSLEMEPVKAGQFVGWRYDKDNAEDNFVDFRLVETFIENEDGDLVQTIILDFNAYPIIDDAFEKNLISE